VSGGTGKGLEGLVEGIKSIEEMFKKRRRKEDKHPHNSGIVENWNVGMMGIV